MSKHFQAKFPSKTGVRPDSSPPTSQPGNEGQPGGRSTNSWWPAVICLALALAVWTVFGQTRHFDFVNYDDGEYVYDNPVVKEGLSLTGIIWAFTHFDGGEWWPLTAISHMVDCELYGLNPGGHHVVNVLLHAVTAILLFLLLRKMTGALGPSGFVAAVFAIHPLRVESVAWVTERKDVLSGLFFMLTLAAYVRYVQRKSNSEVGLGTLTAAPDHGLKTWNFNYVLALLFFTMGLLTKSIVTLPFVLLLLDYWPLRRFASATRCLKPLIIEKVPFFLLSAVSSAVTILAIGEITSGETLSLPWRVGNALMSYAIYLKQMIYPVGLAIFYPHPMYQLSTWGVIGSVVVLLIIPLVVAAGWRKRPYLLVGWLWYLGMLIPVIGLLQVGSQARADRYTYLPQIGLYILLTWGATDLCGRWRWRGVLLGTAATTILIALMVRAHAQTAHWRDSVSLWKHALTCTPENAIALTSLAEGLVAQGKWAEAIPHCKRALQFKPDDAKAHNNWGIALAGQGRLDEAIQHFQQALQIKPNLAEANRNLRVALAKRERTNEIVQLEQALVQKPTDAVAHHDLGAALAAHGKWEEALEHYEQAVNLKADDVMFHNDLAVALTKLNKLEQAIHHCQLALRLNPQDPVARYNLGIALFAQGRVAEAIDHYRRAIQLKPDFAEAHNNISVALAAQGKWTEVVEHCERALRLQPDNLKAQNNLAIALAAQGKLSEAVQHLEQALRLANAQQNTELAEAIRARINFYQAALSP